MIARARWLLPEGIEEVLPEQAEGLERQRRALLDVYHTWGYELVMPPFIEYLESLLVGTSHDRDLQTFKLTDQLSGRMMGVRADMTPQVARIDAHRLKRDVPVRLCYMGTVLRTRAEGVGGSRSPLQVGAELYGHAGVDSDLEVMLLMLETLRTVGIDKLHMDLGHVAVYWNLSRQAGLDAAQEQTLFELLQRKAAPEIAAFLEELSIPEDMRAMLLALVELNGGAEVLERARAVLAAADTQVRSALDYLEEVAQALWRAAPEVELHFDLAELRGYHYTTGIVFAAFVPGVGQEIARGGRYDEIGKVFGRSRPATGFSTDLKSLVRVSSAPAPASTAATFAPADDDPALRERVRALRAAGERVVCALSGQSGDARAMGCTRELVRAGQGWVIRECA